MKKLLIMTGLLLAVTASMASATGVDLNWNNCLFNAAARVADMSFICDESFPGAGDANTQAFQLYGSIRTGVSLPGIKSVNATVDIQTASPVLDPWWDQPTAPATGCRTDQNGVSSMGTLAFQGLLAGELKSCIGTLMAGGVGADSYIENTGGPNRARWNMVASRTTAVTVQGAAKYCIFRATLDSRFTKLDPTDPLNGDHVCQGCLDQACLVLNHVELDADPGVNTPDGKSHFYTQEIANYVTWQGGAIGGNGCPAATPTKKATWGQVKSLYR